MNTPDFRGPDREQRLNEILLNYVEAVQQGHAPDRRLLLALYPEFAADLSDFFAGRDQMEVLAVPLRQASPAGFFRLDGPGLLGDSTQDFVDKPFASGSRNPALPPYLSRASAGPELGQLGDFHLHREVGRGGMGIVYEAQQISLNRRVALKVLPFAAAFDPKQLQRFKNEAQAAAQLHHNNIVPVFAIGYERGVHYYAMQFIEGQSLAAMIRELRDLTATGQAPLADASPALSGDRVAPNSVEQIAAEERKRVPPAGSVKASLETATAAAEMPTERSAHTRRFYRRVAELGKTAANALEIAHQQGVIHRDIKPANLLVDARGNLWITDFGLALFQNEGGITLTGEVLGTLRYMSPEQALGKRALVDRRTDIYSLGVTLYELLTLAPVFDGQDRQELMQQIANEEPRLPRAVQKSIPVELETVILKAIAKNPIERYATAQEFADDLQRFLEDKPILAKRPTVWDKAMKWSRRHRSFVISAVALLVLITIGSLFAVWFVAGEHNETLKAYDQEQKQRKLAEESFRQARRALDFLTQISDDRLADKPELQKVRRELLEAALEYYQNFIEQRGDDPSLQKELAASYARVASLLSELGADFDSLAASEKARRMYEKLISENSDVPEFKAALAIINQHAWRVQGCWDLVFLTNSMVQEDLKLSEDQVAKIQALRDKLQALQEKLWEQRRAAGKEFRKRGSDGHWKPEPPKPEQLSQMRKQAKDNQETIAAILLPNQAERLKQIRYQLDNLSFEDPDVIAELKLTAGQLEEIRSIQSKTGEAIRRYFDPPHRERSFLVVENFWKEARKKIADVLTVEQKDRWAEMTGEPLRGEFHFPPPPWLGPRSARHR